MSRKPAGLGLGCLSLGVATIPNKKTLFITLVDLIPRTEASFLPNLIHLLCLRVTQMPRTLDLAIFVLTDRQNRLLYPLLRMRARGNNETLRD